MIQQEKQKNIDTHRGLSDSEATELLTRYGYNELSSKNKRNCLSIILKIFSEPMLFLLLGGVVIYMVLGEIRDSMVLLASVFLVVSITFYQERKTEKTLEALKNLSSPRALVIRDSRQKRIPGREVVRGDLIILREGDRVPADATVISCENFSADESLLTGESLSVRKSSWDGETLQKRPGGDDSPFIYSGSMIVSGRAIARVDTTGQYTEIGRIGKSLENIKDEDTLIHKETTKIVRTVAVVALSLCVVVFLAYTFIRGNVVEGLLSGLTLAMAILPEEFPVVLMIFMTLGAWRISKRNVLTRRSATIETLGAATVLCTDKTGTLTLNKMQLDYLYADNSFFKLGESDPTNLAEKFQSLLKYGILSSEKNSFDPMEKELESKNGLCVADPINIDTWTLIKEYPLSKKLLVRSHVWQLPENKNLLIAAKGAPEAIVNLCRISQEEKTKLNEAIENMTTKGFRVLGVARASCEHDKLPDEQNKLDFEFVGLLGFIDPARPGVGEAVKEAYNAGIRIIMITGDYPGTAQFLAKEIGMRNSQLFLTGEDLEKMSDGELKEKIKTVNIFARVAPEQKLLIINALKANKEIVAMTGDGVNDAPALKSAHIGIAMGERGTDVARESAALVLLDDDFSSIVAAVRLGRRIYDNLKRAMGYILAVHVPIAGMSVLPIFFDLPAVLFPVHVAFLELIIDPACSTVFESQKEDEKIMQRPPRNLNQPMFTRRTVFVNLAQGFGVLCAIFLLFLFTYSNKGEAEARSLAFISIVFSSISLILINLSWRKSFVRILLSANKAFYAILGGTVIAIAAILYVPNIAQIFYIVPLHTSDFILIISAVGLSLLWFEIAKFYLTHRYKKV